MTTNTSPRSVPCPACNAAAGEPCAAPTNTGRRAVAWFHLARQNEYETTPARVRSLAFTAATRDGRPMAGIITPSTIPGLSRAEVSLEGLGDDAAALRAVQAHARAGAIVTLRRRTSQGATLTIFFDVEEEEGEGEGEGV